MKSTIMKMKTHLKMFWYDNELVSGTSSVTFSIFTLSDTNVVTQENNVISHSHPLQGDAYQYLLCCYCIYLTLHAGS